MVGGAGGDESPGPDDDAHDHPADPSGAGAGSDAELIEAVRTVRPAPGAITPSDAFAELYRRHVDSARALARHLARSGVDAEDLVATAFARLLEAMRAGRGPTEAFRAYLLTSVRHLAYDRQRAERRVDLTDDLGDVVGIDPERTVVPFADPALAGLERTLAARAFATLPERWQAVLWHLEVEGDSPADIAPLFGLTANAVSALAYRAREGLRQAYLQEHLSSGTGRQDRRHRETEQRLGAYTRGGLARRDAARVEAHLAECAECRALAGELREVNSGLVRSVVAPLVLGAGLVGYLASRGSPDYLAMWDHGTGEIAARGGGTVGVVGAVGALVHPAVLSTLLVTAPGGALAVATAGVVGVVGAAGVVGVLTVGGHGAVAPPRADAPVHAPASHPTPPPHPRERPAPTPPSPLAPVPPWEAASPPEPAPRSPSPTTTPLPTRTTGPPTTPLPTRTTAPPRTSAPPRQSTSRPSTSRPTTPRSTTPSPSRTTTPDSTRNRTADPRSSPDREPDAGPVDEHGDDHPTRPLPLLDALGRILAEVVSPAR